jgi:hypothetical protein
MEQLSTQPTINQEWEKNKRYFQTCKDLERSLYEESLKVKLPKQNTNPRKRRIRDTRKK